MKRSISGRNALTDALNENPAALAALAGIGRVAAGSAAMAAGQKAGEKVGSVVGDKVSKVLGGDNEEVSETEQKGTITQTSGTTTTIQTGQGSDAVKTTVPTKFITATPGTDGKPKLSLNTAAIQGKTTPQGTATPQNPIKSGAPVSVAEKFDLSALKRLSGLK